MFCMDKFTNLKAMNFIMNDHEISEFFYDAAENPWMPTHYIVRAWHDVVKDRECPCHFYDYIDWMIANVRIAKISVGEATKRLCQFMETFPPS